MRYSGPWGVKFSAIAPVEIIGWLNRQELYRF